jgi:ABC-type protease/lipase transport system fused ATPase/permease subunit
MFGEVADTTAEYIILFVVVSFFFHTPMGLKALFVNSVCVCVCLGVCVCVCVRACVCLSV